MVARYGRILIPLRGSGSSRGCIGTYVVLLHLGREQTVVPRPIRLRHYGRITVPGFGELLAGRFSSARLLGAVRLWHVYVSPSPPQKDHSGTRAARPEPGSVATKRISFLKIPLSPAERIPGFKLRVGNSFSPSDAARVEMRFRFAYGRIREPGLGALSPGSSAPEVARASMLARVEDGTPSVCVSHI